MLEAKLAEIELALHIVTEETLHLEAGAAIIFIMVARCIGCGYKVYNGRTLYRVRL